MSSNTLSQMLSRKQNGKCPFCGKEVKDDEFRNDISKREFIISGLCQNCQDEIYGVD